MEGESKEERKLTCSVCGSVKPTKSALRLHLGRCKETVTIMVPVFLAGRILGKSGETHQKIKKDTGCQLHFMENTGTHRKLIISGPAAKVKKARAHVEKILETGGSVEKPTVPGGSGREGPASPERMRVEDGEGGELPGTKRGGEGSTRSASPKRNREQDDVRNVVEVFPVDGVSGRVVRYLTDQMGEIVVADTRKGNIEVLFHVNQVWVRAGPGETCNAPFLEVQPLASLESALSGRQLRLNARKREDGKLEATAVWQEGAHPPGYRGSVLVCQLDMQAREQRYRVTRESGLRIDPLSGAPDTAVSARVAEYLSQEVGVLHLEGGEGGAVLFHLNQVWDRNLIAGTKLFRTVQEQPLKQFLPLGTAVLVNMRKLPVSAGSSLKYQATLLWKGAAETYETPQKLLQEYINMYKPYEERVRLVEELDKIHDSVKTVLQLQHGPKSPKYRPVHALLNGLPPGWQAEVVGQLREELGVIRLSQAMGRDMSPGNKFPFVLFHLEDVYDEAGLPAILSPNLTIATMQGRSVQLTARSLCPATDLDGLLDLRRNSEGMDLMLMQAVVVCVKTGPTGPLGYKTFPRPTVLAQTPACIGGGPAAYFLSPTLQFELDSKVRLYKNKLAGPALAQFCKIGKLIDEEDEALDKLDVIKEQLDTVDVNNTKRFTFGKLPHDALPFGQMFQNVSSAHIKKLFAHPARPVYLHAHGLTAQTGVVELTVSHPVDGKVKTYGVFQLAQYRFVSPSGYFDQDLANVIKMPAREEFAVCAKLAFPDSKIPYIVNNIWNEKQREELKQDLPIVPYDEQVVHAACVQSVMEMCDLRKSAKTTRQVVGVGELKGNLKFPVDSSPSDPTKLVLAQEEEVEVEKYSQDMLEVNAGEVEVSTGELEDSAGEVEDKTEEVEDTGGEVFTVKEFRSLLDKTKNIRNVSVHGHNKTMVTNWLLEKAEVVFKTGKDPSSHLTKNAPAAYMFFDMEKKDLDFITQPKTKNAKTGEFETGFLINLIDSSGLGSLSTVEQAGRTITDGVIVVVDCIAGVCSQTEVVLKQAVKARIKPVLFINTMDRALIELHMEEEELYETVKEIIEKVNNVLANNDGAMGAVRVDVNNGSVLFGSTLHGWAFSLKQVAEMYASKLEMPVDRLMQRLWGENFVNHETLDWEKKKSKDNKRSFCAFALTPLSKVITAIMNFKKNTTGKLLSQVATAQGKLLKDVLTAEEMELEGEPLMKCVMRHWLPAGEAMLQIITIHLPSPIIAQKYKAELLYQGHHDHLPPYAMQAIKNCDPQAPLVMYVSKMLPTADSEHFYAFGRVFSGKVATGMKARIMGVDTGELIQGAVIQTSSHVLALGDVSAGNLCSIVTQKFMSQHGLILGTELEGMTSSSGKRRIKVSKSTQARADSVTVLGMSDTDSQESQDTEPEDLPKGKVKRQGCQQKREARKRKPTPKILENETQKEMGL